MHFLYSVQTRSPTPESAQNEEVIEQLSDRSEYLEANNHIQGDDDAAINEQNAASNRILNFNNNLYNMQGVQITCLNCSKVHDSGYCMYPFYWVPCCRCIVFSLDGSGHMMPCGEVNTISPFRDIILSQPLIAMYTMRLSKRLGDMLFLNRESGRFELFENKQRLTNSYIEGLFMFKSTENYNVLSYGASTFTRFSVVIAVLSNGYWRARFRVVTSNIHGLLVFKLRNTIPIQNGRVILPDEFKKNTVLVLGIKPSSYAVKVEFRVFANTGRSSNYSGCVVWQNNGRLGESNNIDDIIDGETPKPKRLFNSQLYREQPMALAPLRERDI